MKNPFLSLFSFVNLSQHLSIHYPGPRWAVVWAYLLTIYLTLPLTPFVVRFVFKTIGKNEAFTLISVGLILALFFAIVVMFHRIRKDQRTIAMLPFVAIIGLAYSMDNAVERIHFLEYGILAFLVFRAAGRPRGTGLLWVYLAVVGAGFSDEIIQWMLPNRHFDLRDVGMNAVGAAIGLWFGTMVCRQQGCLEDQSEGLVLSSA
ncbi:MAG: VanZ family protein [Magnetococcales bacterium]|nr:VanZ family protein [Magnetococcales bacterium]MBF0437723.1 VanZ family protein [Magnetococcales bacterium]